MRYRVYSGPNGSQDIAPLAKEQMLFKEFAGARRGAVVGAARRAQWPHAAADRRRRRHPLDRRAIVDALRVGEREQVGALTRRRRFHSTRARSVSRCHLWPTTSQFTNGRWMAFGSFRAAMALWES